MKSEQDFKVFAAKQLAAIYDIGDYGNILQTLQNEDRAFQKIHPTSFSLEFLASRLALACHAWSKICEESKIKDVGIKNIFFKTVMQSFQTPKVVDIASAFSDYLHAPAAEEKSVLAVTALLMKRLGLAETLKKSGQLALPAGFRLLIDADDGFKNSFENEFFEFLNT